MPLIKTDAKRTKSKPKLTHKAVVPY